MVYVKIPNVCETISSFRIIELVRNTNDIVEKDEILIEIECDKTILTVNAEESGKIEVLVNKGDIVSSGIPFKDIDFETLSLWRNEVTNCHWLYNEQTDYFIKSFSEELNHEVIFVRCVNNGWFSIGHFGGRLDHDGTLFELMNENYPK